MLFHSLLVVIITFLLAVDSVWSSLVVSEEIELDCWFENFLFLSIVSTSRSLHTVTALAASYRLRYVLFSFAFI